MTNPLIDPAHIDELEWPALRPGGEDVAAIDDTDAVAAMRRDLATAETHIKALQAKLDALAPHGSCGCNYDAPGQVCQHHSPQLVEALARAVKAEADLKTLNETWVAALSGLVERAATAEAERDALRLAIAGQPMDPILKNGSYVEMACTTREARAYAKANHAAAEAEVARLAGLLAEAEWKPAEAAPKDGTPVTARIVWTMRWKPYSKIDRQRMGGRAGRWQGANSFGGWDNTDFEPDAIRLKEKPDAK
jgi:hypothetical protein